MTTIPYSGDTRLYRFCSYNANENETHFVLKCPLYNSIWNKLPSLFENKVPGSLKSFYHLNHQVDISVYLTETTIIRHSRELASLKTS